MRLQNPTPEQREAITTAEPTLMMIAGPGSGKTATLVSRVEAVLEQGVPPAELVMLTFTNAAAHELAERIGSELEFGFIGTLHAFALRLLKRYSAALGYANGVALIDEEAADDLLAEVAKQMGCRDSLSRLKSLRAEGVPTLAAHEFSVDRLTVREFYEQMRAFGVVDYDALLTEFERLLKDPPAELEALFAHLFVDEVQDSSPIDWRIYRALPIPNKCFVGDPDQAIYSFRGGDVSQMLQVSQDPTVCTIKLEANFRSTAEICAAAQRLIEQNERRMQKVTRAVTDRRGSVTLLEMAETGAGEIEMVIEGVRKQLAAGIESVAILARTNAIADEFRKSMQAADLELVQRKITLLPRDWKLARSVVEFVSDPDNDVVAFGCLQQLLIAEGVQPKAAKKQAREARIAAASAGLPLNRASLLLRHDRILQASTVVRSSLFDRASREARSIIVEKLRELPRDATAADLALALADVRQFEQEDGGGRVRVSTIHGAKGREFDVVFMVGMEEEVFPGRRNAAEQANIEEERRIAYVGATRARTALFLSWARMRRTPWNAIETHRPSRFIGEIVGGDL